MTKKREVAKEVIAKMYGWPDWPTDEGLRFLRFMAMDKQGYWYGFIHEPTISDESWKAVDRHKIILHSPDVFDSEMSTKLWKESLRVRPKDNVISFKDHSNLSDQLVWPIDEQYEYMACDRNNHWWAFIEPPELTIRGWAVVIGHPAALYMSDRPDLTVEWQNSLVARA